MAAYQECPNGRLSGVSQMAAYQECPRWPLIRSVPDGRLSGVFIERVLL